MRPVAAILAEYIADMLEPTPSLDAVEAYLAAAAPQLQPGGFAAILNHLPAAWQPRLHLDADALASAEGAG
jgi:hypothetical protein